MLGSFYLTIQYMVGFVWYLSIYKVRKDVQVCNRLNMRHSSSVFEYNLVVSTVVFNIDMKVIKQR